MWRLVSHTRCFGHDDLWPDRVDNLVSDFVLQFENVGQMPIVPVGPQVNAVAGVDQLGGYPDPIRCLTHTPLEHVAHAQLFCHFADINRFAFECEAGIAGDNEEPALLGQTGNDVFCEAVGEVILFRVTAHVLERQHGDGGFVGQF
jgi:hypothetical protein